MPGFDWTTIQFAKGKETQVPGSAGGTTAIPRLEFHLQLLLMVLQACIKSIKKILALIMLPHFRRYSAASTWNHFDQYRGKSDGNEVKEYGVDVFVGTR
jgi:hypothetical protein